MPDEKLTDAEIKKALECCSVGTFACDEQCPCFHSKSNLKINSCRFELIGDALDLINCLQLDNEMLRTQNGLLVAEQELNIKGISATALKHKKEAYKECIDIIKNQIQNNNAISVEWLREYLDNLLKKLVGEDK